jgi:hypothetical protein
VLSAAATDGDTVHVVPHGAQSYPPVHAMNLPPVSMDVSNTTRRLLFDFVKISDETSKRYLMSPSCTIESGAVNEFIDVGTITIEPSVVNEFIDVGTITIEPSVVNEFIDVGTITIEPSVVNAFDKLTQAHQG